MRLSDLISQLEDLQDEHGDIEVVAAYQPSYPLAGQVMGACVIDDAEAEDDEPTDAAPTVAWIAVGDHPHNLSPYAPRAVFEEIDR